MFGFLVVFGLFLGCVALAMIHPDAYKPPVGPVRIKPWSLSIIIFLMMMICVAAVCLEALLGN